MTIKYLERKEERAITCKDYVVSREITMLLKIAVDYVKMGLCESRDYFASLTLVAKSNKS